MEKHIHLHVVVVVVSVLRALYRLPQWTGTGDCALIMGAHLSWLFARGLIPEETGSSQKGIRIGGMRHASDN